MVLYSYYPEYNKINVCKYDLKGTYIRSNTIDAWVLTDYMDGYMTLIYWDMTKLWTQILHKISPS